MKSCVSERPLKCRLRVYKLSPVLRSSVKRLPAFLHSSVWSLSLLSRQMAPDVSIVPWCRCEVFISCLIPDVRGTNAKSSSRQEKSYFFFQLKNTLFVLHFSGSCLSAVWEIFHLHQMPNACMINFYSFLRGKTAYLLKTHQEIGAPSCFIGEFRACAQKLGAFYPPRKML